VRKGLALVGTCALKTEITSLLLLLQLSSNNIVDRTRAGREAFLCLSIQYIYSPHLPNSLNYPWLQIVFSAFHL
jgi:hypothetical protein